MDLSKPKHISFGIDFILSSKCESKKHPVHDETYSLYSSDKSASKHDMTICPTKKVKDVNFSSSNHPTMSPMMLLMNLKPMTHHQNNPPLDATPQSQQTLKTEMKPRTRTPFTTNQLSCLEESYRDMRGYLTLSERDRLAEQLGLEEKQVRVWFQNRSTREKRQKRQVDTTMDTSYKYPYYWPY